MCVLLSPHGFLPSLTSLLPGVVNANLVSRGGERGAVEAVELPVELYPPGGRGKIAGSAQHPQVHHGSLTSSA